MVKISETKRVVATLPKETPILVAEDISCTTGCLEVNHHWIFNICVLFDNILEEITIEEESDGPTTRTLSPSEMYY